jgi:hypothetical protein
VNFTIHCDLAVLRKTINMKRLDFAAMENIQGGSAGNIAITLPLSSLLSTLGLGSLIGLGLELGVGISYNIDAIPSNLLGSL